MLRNWLGSLRKCLVGACLVLAAAATTTTTGRADDAADLRKLIEEQSRQIEDLKKRLDASEQISAEADAEAQKPGGDGAVKKIVADYLKAEEAKKKAADAKAKTKLEEEGYKVGTD